LRFLLDREHDGCGWASDANDERQRPRHQRIFEAKTGRLTGIKTGIGSTNAVQDLYYTYDRLSNPPSRTRCPPVRVP